MGGGGIKGRSRKLGRPTVNLNHYPNYCFLTIGAADSVLLGVSHRNENSCSVNCSTLRQNVAEYFHIQLFG